MVDGQQQGAAHQQQQADRDQRFHTAILQHGRGFAVLFYLLTGLAGLAVLHDLVTALLAGQLGAVLAAVAFLGLIGYILRKRRLYAAVFLLILPVELLTFYLGLSLAPLLGYPAVYAAALLIPGTVGAAAAYLFHHVSKTGNGVVIGGAAGTAIYAGIAGLGAVVTTAMRSIAEMGAATGGSTNAGVMEVFQFDQAANPDLVFVLGAAAFTLPFLYSYVQKEERQHRVWAVYLVPVLLYLAAKAAGTMLITVV